jgi:hypothetical protein
MIFRPTNGEFVQRRNEQMQQESCFAANAFASVTQSA